MTNKLRKAAPQARPRRLKIENRRICRAEVAAGLAVEDKEAAPASRQSLEATTDNLDRRCVEEAPGPTQESSVESRNGTVFVDSGSAWVILHKF